ncbi:LacI family transcriptional regulator [Flagellimonas sp. HMM57]|uniref:LacI family DNA-binding transcriptional regulator n=1 Tax=unclassified Flagellimonas TaxID=2644544 RepID=UPI0013D1CD41|nr:MULTISPECIES: LacI family DNA-binding transcriptional regulator [unclassified Flagellimonas]UII75346.1 LacI family transcriptional regulator [Flagellimonas sp. HMM57]
MKRITIKDVAKRLNVSISSVSRAFNDKYDIKKETRELILTTAKEMGYSPNPIAKKLSQNKTFNIGVVVPEFISEFFSEIIMAVQEVFINEGYQVLVMQSEESPIQELKNVKTLINNMIDGLIIAPATESNNMEYYLEQKQNGYPIVFLGRVEESLQADKVLFNNQKWSFFATEHLISQGYKKIYHLAGHKNLCVSNERIKGFLKAIRKHKFPKGNYKIIETGLLAKEGIEIIEDLIYKHDLPDAFYCENDLVAIGAMKKLKDNGYRVPEDIAIMGFTETRMAELVTPPLSSVKQPTFEMGRRAAELLLELMKHKSQKTKTIVLNGELKIRRSSTRNVANLIN